MTDTCGLSSMYPSMDLNDSRCSSLFFIYLRTWENMDMNGDSRYPTNGSLDKNKNVNRGTYGGIMWIQCH